MKTTATVDSHKIAGTVTEGGKFFIADDPDVHEKIGEMLRDMYQDPIWAVVREYAANALDSDVTKPITIQLPSRSKCELVIIDNGPGIPKDLMITQLTGYGISDKRGDTLRIGGFGIGSKCGLAYTSSFTYGSVYIDKETGLKRKTVLTCFLDEHLKPSYNVMADVNLKADDESPTGVTVTIPVKASDIDRFEAATHNFMFSKAAASRIRVTKSTILGLDLKLEHFAPVGIQLQRTVTVAGHSATVGMYFPEHQSWESNCKNKSIMGGCGSVVVVMNGVPYPVELRTLVGVCDKKQFSFKEVLGHDERNVPCMLIEVDGSTELVPTPSRETIKMSPVCANFMANILNAYSTRMCEDFALDPEKVLTEVKMSTKSDAEENMQYAIAGFHTRIKGEGGNSSSSSSCKDWSTQILNKLNKHPKFSMVALNINFKRTLQFPAGYTLIHPVKKRRIMYTNSNMSRDLEFNLSALKIKIIMLKDIPDYAKKYYVDSVKRLSKLDKYDGDVGTTSLQKAIPMAAKEWLKDDNGVSSWGGRSSKLIVVETPSIIVDKGMVPERVTKEDLVSILPACHKPSTMPDGSDLLNWPSVRVINRNYVSTPGSKKTTSKSANTVLAKPSYILLSSREADALPHHHLTVDKTNLTEDSWEKFNNGLGYCGGLAKDKFNAMLPEIVYFIEHAKFKSGITVTGADCRFSTNEVNRLTPALYVRRLLSPNKNMCKEDLWESFYTAVDKYIETRPKIVQEWLLTQPFYNSFRSNYSEAEIEFILKAIMKTPAKSDNVNTLFTLVASETVIKEAKKKKHPLFKEWTDTDLWLGHLAQKSSVVGFLFRKNDLPTTKFATYVDRDSTIALTMPGIRLFRQVLDELIKSKHPILSVLSAAETHVGSNTAHAKNTAGVKLVDAFPCPTLPITQSILDFVMNVV